MRRRLAVLSIAAVLSVVLAACTGPTTTTSATADFTCTSAPGDAHWAPPSTISVSFSLDTPEWATAGSTIDLSNLKVSEASTSDIVEVELGLTGLADFTQPGIPAQISRSDVMYNSNSDGTFPTESTTLTGAVGTYATVDVTSMPIIDLYLGIPISRTCTPDAGPIRLASILVHSDPAS